MTNYLSLSIHTHTSQLNFYYESVVNAEALKPGLSSRKQVILVDLQMPPLTKPFHFLEVFYYRTLGDK